MHISSRNFKEQNTVQFGSTFTQIGNGGKAVCSFAMGGYNMNDQTGNARDLVGKPVEWCHEWREYAGICPTKQRHGRALTGVSCVVW
jgi:hypothetical protein